MEHAFHLSWQFASDYEGLSCANSELQKIASAFIRNMNRVRGIGTLPINLIAIGVVNEAARIEALVNKNIPLRDPRITPDSPKFDSALFEEVNKERSRLLHQWFQNDPDFRLRVINFGVQGMNEIIEANEAQSKDGVQATMAAMLIGLWTAFESLAQDTWITAVNACPSPLADNVMSDSGFSPEGGESVKVIILRALCWKRIRFSPVNGKSAFHRKESRFSTTQKHPRRVQGSFCRSI
jgi:hypothetical protein